MTRSWRRDITTKTGSPRHTQSRGARGDSGLTFVEVLGVLGVVGILLVVAMPQLQMPEGLSATSQADQIAVDLRWSRQLAIAKRVNYALEFSPAAAPYTSYLIRNESTAQVEPDFPKDIPSDVTVSGRRTFIFWPSGCVDDDGAGTTCAGTDDSVTVTSGAKTATVQVFWYTGRVKVVDP